MSSYVLQPAAQEDLADIRDYYFEEAGYRVARQMLVEFVETFRFRARSPGAGNKREDLAEDRPILFWPMRDYLILYKANTSPLEIIAIARGSQDLPKMIGRRGFGRCSRYAFPVPPIELEAPFERLQHVKWSLAQIAHKSNPVHTR